MPNQSKPSHHHGTSDFIFVRLLQLRQLLLGSLS